MHGIGKGVDSRAGSKVQLQAVSVPQLHRKLPLSKSFVSLLTMTEYTVGSNAAFSGFFLIGLASLH